MTHVFFTAAYLLRVIAPSSFCSTVCNAQHLVTDKIAQMVSAAHLVLVVLLTLVPCN